MKRLIIINGCVIFLAMCASNIALALDCPSTTISCSNLKTEATCTTQYTSEGLTGAACAWVPTSPNNPAGTPPFVCHALRDSPCKVQ